MLFAMLCNILFVILYDIWRDFCYMAYCDIVTFVIFVICCSVYMSVILVILYYRMYVRMKRPSAAVQDCDRALELNTNSALAYKQRGRAYRSVLNLLCSYVFIHCHLV